MTVGVLFRGPIRPNITNVLKNKANFLAQLDSHGIQYETWLSTWNTRLGQRIIETVPLNEFDNVISMNEPDDNCAMRMWGFEKVGSGQSSNRIWKSMYSSRVALEAMHLTGKYEWLVHARTDGDYDIWEHLPTWFVKDSIGTKHVTPRVNDMLNIGPTNLMSDMYNYGSIQDLGNFIRNSFCAEEVLMNITHVRAIKWHEAKFNKVWMDEERNIGDPMV